MKKCKIMYFISTILFIILLQGLFFAQNKVNVSDVKVNFDKYKDEKIIIEGFVTQYIEDVTETTDFYFLKDDWGGIIKVRTSQSLPEVGKRYEVVGIVDKDINTEDIYLSEENRALLTVAPPPTFWEKLLSWIKSNRIFLLGGLGGLIIILLVAILVYALRQKRAITTDLSVSSVSREEAREAKEREAIPEPEEVLEGTTVKMAIPPPGTLKLLPGKFIVLEGDEKIKEIRFYKEKGALESEITFGRAAGPSYTHIQLKPMTVSAKQAKLIYAGNKFTLINYSDTNPTHVNGIALPENGSIEIKNGDKVEMGEMILEFRTAS